MGGNSINTIINEMRRCKMKLNEINGAVHRQQLTEGVIPIHIVMLLQNVVNAGASTNPVEIFVMSNLVQLFQNGETYRWPRDLNAIESNSEQIAKVEALSDKDKVKLAEALLFLLDRIAHYESDPLSFISRLANPQLDTNKWVAWVKKRDE